MIHFTTSTQAPEKISADALALFLFDGKIEKNSSLDRIDQLMAGLISETLKKEEFKGKVGEVKVFHTHHKIKAPSLILVGLGELKKFDLEAIRKAAGTCVSTADALKAKVVVFNVIEACRALESLKEISGATAEGIVLGAYRFNDYKSKNPESVSLKEVSLPADSKKEQEEIQAGAERGQLVSEATNYARNLINIPAADKPPEYLGREALKIKGIRTRVYKLNELKKMKMNGIVGVGQGSRNSPVFIEMIYRPTRHPRKVIALIGKGVTFDSGGLSLKPPKSMETMKDDMSAAASLLAVMSIIKEINPPVEVRAYIPSAENMPGGRAIRPGDVLKMYNEKTVEVLNTDAEGRLILADALSYACRKKPDLIIDAATLTGACLVALGELYAALLSNNPKLAQDLIEAGKKSGEKMWELPLVEEYKDDLKSNVADIQNIGGSYGGTITGALFLQEFVEKGISWAHLDIAGPSWANKPWAYCPKGGTGFLVRTLCRFLCAF